jgi:MFS family permease
VTAATPGPASPLAIPDYRFFWIARFSAAFATTALIVVIGWQVYDVARTDYGMSLGEAAFQLGLLGAVQFVPLALLTPVAGWAADRFERRLVARLANGVDVLIALTLGIATAADALNLPLLFGLAAAHGMARVFVGPALSAIAPNIVPPALLPRAIAMNSIAFYSASVSGPAMGGFLYAINPALTYWTGAGCLTIAIISLSFVRRVMPPAMSRASHPIRQMVDGLSYVRGHRFLLGAITLDLFAVLLGGATALLPVFARDILKVGPEGLGWLRAAPAMGGALVALTLAWRPIRSNVGVKMLLGVAGFGVATIVFGLSRTLPLSLLALAVLGAADMLSVYVRSSLVQLHTPDTMRGRVSAVSGLAISASNELGELESGLLAALLGPVGAVVAGGAGAIVVTGIYAYYFPELRRARTFDPPDTALAEAIAQEKPS